MVPQIALLGMRPHLYFVERKTEVEGELRLTLWLLNVLLVVLHNGCIVSGCHDPCQRIRTQIAIRPSSFELPSWEVLEADCVVID